MFILTPSTLFTQKDVRYVGLSLGYRITCSRITKEKNSPFPTWSLWSTKDNWGEKGFDKRKVEVKRTANFVYTGTTGVVFDLVSSLSIAKNIISV